MANFTGTNGKDTLIGSVDDDLIDGRKGADTMVGLAGNDTYRVDNIGDKILEDPTEGIDTVRATVSIAKLWDDVENAVLEGKAALNVTGNDLDNHLTGNDAANVIDGGSGGDFMAGHRGNDTYIVDNVNDFAEEHFNEGIDLVRSSISFFLGDNVENLVLTGGGGSDGTGNILNNVIVGNGAGNKLDGGAGADTLIGGGGDDTYFVDSTGDKVVEAKGGGFDVVHATADYSIAQSGEVEDLFLDAGIKATGNALGNLMAGNAADNVIDGGKGADSMFGRTGDDTYLVDNLGDHPFENDGEGSDTVISSIALQNAFNNVEFYRFNTAQAVHFTGNDLNNLIVGGSGGDTLDGGAGNDELNGGKGADTLTGGTGDDIYHIDNAGDQVVEQPGGGFDEVLSTVSITKLWDNVEVAFLAGGSTPLNLVGNDLANNLGGNSGNNVIDGGKGADFMLGGLGNDTYVVDDAGDSILETAKAGTDLVKSAISYTLDDNLENLTLTGKGDINGTGNGLANIIVGNDGANKLDGGGGKDTLIGGAGDDSYFVTDPGDKVVETKGGGLDTVFTTVDIVLAANVENAVAQSGFALKLTGNALSNTLTGGAGDDVLNGGAGADVLNGAQGNDTYIVDNPLDQVQEAANGGFDTIISTFAFSGANPEVEAYVFNTAKSVHFTGGANTFEVTGGSGADFITVTNANHATVFGRGGNDHLTGGSAEDHLDGGTGADVLQGFGGDDDYVVDNVKDQVLEAVGGGRDSVEAMVSIAHLADNVEDLKLIGSGNLNATGNDSANILFGNVFNNKLDGGAGDDQLFGGGKGNDTLIGGSGHDAFLVTFNKGAGGHATVADFVKAEDVLDFIGVTDTNKDGHVDIADVGALVSKVVDHGAGKAVDLFFANGTEVTVNHVGTGAVHSLDNLVATGVQVEVNVGLH